MTVDNTVSIWCSTTRDERMRNVGSQRSYHVLTRCPHFKIEKNAIMVGYINGVRISDCGSEREK